MPHVKGDISISTSATVEGILPVGANLNVLTVDSAEILGVKWAVPAVTAATPLGTLGYAQVVADQTGITTEVDLTGLSVAVTVGTGRRIEIIGSIGWFSTVADDTVLLAIKEGVDIHQFERDTGPVAGRADGMEKTVVLTPTAGAHTYKLSLRLETGTGTVTMQAGSNHPAFILVKDIGV